MARVISRVPRGFTRYYVLYIIEERPMTGKEIIDEAERRSEGAWRPSPGLIYPLLGRLLRDGLIEEARDGRFTITPEGRLALKNHANFQRQLERQLRLVMKLGISMLTAGKFLAEEAIDRVTAVTSMVKKRVARGSEELQRNFYASYKAFLESELEKLEKERFEEM